MVSQVNQIADRFAELLGDEVRVADSETVARAFLTLAHRLRQKQNRLDAARKRILALPDRA